MGEYDELDYESTDEFFNLIERLTGISYVEFGHNPKYIVGEISGGNTFLSVSRYNDWLLAFDTGGYTLFKMK